MKATTRNNRAIVSISLICLILGLTVAIFGITPTASAEEPATPGNSTVGNSSSPVGPVAKTANPAAGTTTPTTCSLEAGKTPKGLSGNVNTRYDLNPPVGLGYVNNDGPCVWVVYLASYRMAGTEQINGQTLYDSASVTIYPGQRLTLQIKIPTECRTQVDLVADKVVDLSNVNYPIYHESGRYIAGVYAGGSNLCVAGEGTPISTTAAPTTIPTTVAPTTSAPTTTAVPTTPAPTTSAPVTEAPTTAAPTTVAPTTAVPTTTAPATTSAPATAAPVTTNPPTTVAPVTTSAPVSAAPVTSAPASSAPVTSAPGSTGTTESGAATTTPPSAVLSGEVTRPPAAVAGTGNENNPAAVEAASAPGSLPSTGQGEPELSQYQTNPLSWLLPVLIVVGMCAAVGLQLIPKQEK